MQVSPEFLNAEDVQANGEHEHVGADELRGKLGSEWILLVLDLYRFTWTYMDLYIFTLVYTDLH